MGRRECGREGDKDDERGKERGVERGREKAGEGDRVEGDGERKMNGEGNEKVV